MWDTSTPIRRILVNTSLSPESRSAIESATAIARVFGASIDLIHVRDALQRSLEDERIVGPGERDTNLDRIDDALAAEAQAVVDAGVSCVTTSLHGSLHARIVSHAEKTHADLIVVGELESTHRRLAPLGTVAQRLLHRARCPVLVVRA